MGISDVQPIPLALQTAFADLIERCIDAGFDRDFDEQGQFVKVTSKGREYWYFQLYGGGTRTRRYVGPVAEDAITRRVDAFGRLKGDFTERREMVRALSTSLPQPDALTGDVIDALWKAGFFRLRGVLIGTVAFQTYAGLLGTKLPGSAIMTQDADFAQFKAISDAVKDSMPPIIDILKAVDDTFEAVATIDGPAAVAFSNRQKYRVEFLTPNRSKSEYGSRPASMPALGGASAQPLRYLDFLIHEPVWSVILHRGGVPVRVPQPARYAVHKLIVSTLRPDRSRAKSDKDLIQASTLIEALSARRSFELGEALHVAETSGPKWKAAIERATTGLDAETVPLLAKAREAYRLG
jgi:hypothetical protein